MLSCHIFQYYLALRESLGRKRPGYEDVDHYNILVIGPEGSGKSAFINTVLSAVKGQEHNMAFTGSGDTVVTKHVSTNNVSLGKEHY